MNTLRKIAFLKATELTRAGKLKEALASIRDGFSNIPGPQPAAPKLSGLGDLFGKLADLPTGRAVPEDTGLPPGAQFLAGSFTAAAGRRDYKLYVPRGYAGRAVPLVVMLHGCTQSPDDFAAGTRMNELAEEKNFLVLYPAQSKSANISKCWNWFNAADQQRDAGEPSLIAGMTRQVMAEYAVDARRVYAAGLSAGGAEAAILGETYPELFAAIGVHSGLACGAATSMASAFTAMQRGGPMAAIKASAHERPVPTIVFHGDRDTTVNVVNGGQVIAQSSGAARLESMVSNGETGGMAYTRTVMAAPGGKDLLEQWVLHGAGHAWSGGSAAGSFTDSRGPDASREMVRFFLQHPEEQPARGWFS